MKRIEIIERNSGLVAASMLMILARLNYETTTKDYEDEAWRSAVDDKSVDPNRRDDYTFNIVDAKSPA